ncbi:MAG: hypothetical protein GX096_09225 [Clostridiales bacterium]|nr:hypothetical protein [Clostridiales bacterium]
MRVSQSFLLWFLFLLMCVNPQLSVAATLDTSDAVTEIEATQIMKEQARNERALLVGVDHFVTKPSIYPSSTNNIYAMQTVFQSTLKPLKVLMLPDEPITSAESLTALIQDTFHKAKEGDVSYFYISTHGVYDPESGEEPRLLLSDGVTEGCITPAQLEAAFDGILGTKVLMLDACNSGSFISKGMVSRPDHIYFQGDDFKVLTSSGAMEESWYWNAEEGTELSGNEPQGAFYFTLALGQSLSAGNGYPADQNRDGSVTLSELYHYLYLNHGASSPQVYPQEDSFVVFRYDAAEALPTGLDRSPIIDVTFSGTLLSKTSRKIAIEFIATRPVRVAYQVVPQIDGKWHFDSAKLIYDQDERYTAYGDRAGAVSAGRKERTLAIDLEGENYGYVLVQLVSIDDGKLTVHAGRVLSVPPDIGEVNLETIVQPVFEMTGGAELSIFVGHDYPCSLSVAIVDENDKVIHRICHRQSARSMQLDPQGSIFYWDGKLKSGDHVTPGTYRVRTQAIMNDTNITAFSSEFEIK